MTTQPALVAKQVRLKEWAKQIHAARIDQKVWILKLGAHRII